VSREAYAAGVFDADGVLGYYGYKKVLAVGMQDRELMDWFVQEWGGKIYLHGRVWRWELLRNAEKVVFVQDILPFSRTKKPQLELMLDVLLKRTPLGEADLKIQFKELIHKHTLAGPWADRKPSTETKGGE
jgi:hypothetical protein